MLVIILVFFVMQKPHWCLAKGENMLPDCSSDITGDNKYYLINTTFIDPRISFIVCFGLMYFLMVMQVIKVQTSINVKKIEYIKMILMVVIFSISLLLTMLETFDFIEKSDLNNMFKMIFIMVNLKDVIRSVVRICKMLYLSNSVLLLQFVNLFIFALIARVIFEGVEIGSDSFIFMYSFTSFFRSFDTMFKTLLMENFPDILVDSYEINYIYVGFFILFIFISSIIVFSLVVGVFYFHYQSFYIDNINKMEAKYPEFKEKIVPIMDKRYLNSNDIDRVLYVLLKKVEKDQRIST